MVYIGVSSIVTFLLFGPCYKFQATLTLVQNYSTYKSRVDFMCSLIKLLLVTMPFVVKVEFSRYLNLQSLLSV
jgi:hypothetical protein